MKKLFSLIIGCLLFSQVSYANFYLGGTRLIYNEGTNSSSIRVGNKSKSSIYLVQSWVSNATGKTDRNFTIVPPLFRLNADETNLIRVSYKGNPKNLPQDRESVFYLNVKAIPSEDKNVENKLSLAFNNQIKLFYRPKALKFDPSSAYKEIKASKSQNSLVISNPTPYHITFTSIKIADREVLKEPTMISPFGRATYPFPNASVRSEISWETINDFGGKDVYKKLLNE